MKSKKSKTAAAFAELDLGEEDDEGAGDVDLEVAEQQLEEKDQHDTGSSRHT